MKSWPFVKSLSDKESLCVVLEVVYAHSLALLYFISLSVMEEAWATQAEATTILCHQMGFFYLLLLLLLLLIYS